MTDEKLTIEVDQEQFGVVMFALSLAQSACGDLIATTSDKLTRRRYLRAHDVAQQLHQELVPMWTPEHQKVWNTLGLPESISRTEE